MESCQCVGFMCLNCQKKTFNEWCLTQEYNNALEKSHQEGREGMKKLLMKILSTSNVQYYSNTEIIALINTL